MVKTFLGEILLETGLISRTELNHALALQNRDSRFVIGEMQPESLIRSMRGQGGGRRLGDILVNLGCVTSADIHNALRLQETGIDSYLSLGDRKLASFFRLLPLVNSESSLPEILSEILQILLGLVEAEAGTIMLYDEQTGELVFSVPSGPAASMLVDYRIPAADGIAGWVFTHDSGVRVDDAEHDERFFGAVDLATGFRTRAILCVPLRYRSRVIGVLEVINRKGGGSFTEQDELLLTIFSTQAAVTIENCRMYAELSSSMEDLRERNDELRKSAEERLRKLEDVNRKLLLSEQRLSERETFFREMVEKSVEVISWTDSEGYIEYVSPSIHTLLGYRPEEIIGRHFSEFVYTDDAEVAEQAVKKGFQLDQTISENRLVTRSGEVKWVRFSSVKATDSRGERGLHGMLTDITETKMLQSMLIQRERFAALGELAAAVAHEMNSPLQGISSLLSYLRKRTAGNETNVGPELALIEEAFSRIDETAKKLLSLGRPGERDRIGIHINESISKILSLEESVLKRSRIEVTFTPAVSDTLVAISASGLGQIFINLINNTIEAMAGSEGERRIIISVSILPETQQAEIRFRDTGPGFEPGIVQHLFEPFRSGSKSKGAGVGLGICKAIVEGTGGAMNAETGEAGNGAVFVIHLPVLQRE